jgi:hypothetical protein
LYICGGGAVFSFLLHAFCILHPSACCIPAVAVLCFHFCCMHHAFCISCVVYLHRCLHSVLRLCCMHMCSAVQCYICISNERT